MKMKNAANIWRVLVAVSFTASCTLAQGSIADEDLLKMLDGAAADTVAEEATVAEVETVAEPEPVVAEVEEAPATVEDVPAEEIAEPTAKPDDGEIDDLGMVSYDNDTASTLGDLISVRLNNVKLEEAINLFAQLSGANIIVPELTEAAQISVNLKDVEWRPALQSILDAYNYELFQRVPGSNVYSVRRRPAGAPEPQVVETFKLRYATVPNAAALIRELLPEDAKVSEFASRNMIVVKTSESKLGEVRSVLTTIDTVRQQVFIESKFMELSDGSQLDLGVDWKQLGLDSQGKGGLGASVGPTGQTYTDGRQLTEVGPTDATIPVPIDNFSDHIFTSVLDVDQFSMVLTALESDRGVNVVSNPKIIVANEEKANITIITKEPNLLVDRKAALNDTEDTITFSLDPDQPFFEYGIVLDVTPSINTSSNITVNIKPSLTRKVDEKVVGDGDAQLSYPFITEKTVETVFNLTSGQTAAIGGLTEVSDSIKERKIPVLGSIPFLGRLFSWKQTISDQTETIIFVTVGLANTQDIGIESGLPEDSDLARLQLIKDQNTRELREQTRKYYQIKEGERLDDTLKSMDAQETKRLEKREKMIEKSNK